MSQPTQEAQGTPPPPKSQLSPPESKIQPPQPPQPPVKQDTPQGTESSPSKTPSLNQSPPENEIQSPQSPQSPQPQAKEDTQQTQQTQEKQRELYDAALFTLLNKLVSSANNASEGTEEKVDKDSSADTQGEEATTPKANPSTNGGADNADAAAKPPITEVAAKVVVDATAHPETIHDTKIPNEDTIDEEVSQSDKPIFLCVAREKETTCKLYLLPRKNCLVQANVQEASVLDHATERRYAAAGMIEYTGNVAKEERHSGLFHLFTIDVEGVVYTFKFHNKAERKSEKPNGPAADKWLLVDYVVKPIKSALSYFFNFEKKLWIPMNTVEQIEDIAQVLNAINTKKKNTSWKNDWKNATFVKRQAMLLELLGAEK